MLELKLTLYMIDFKQVEAYLRVYTIADVERSIRSTPPLWYYVGNIRSSVWLPETRFITEKHANEPFYGLKTHLSTSNLS